MIEFYCPQCNQRISAPRKLEGQSVQCPTCRNSLLVPSDDQDSSQPQPSQQPQSKPQCDVIFSDETSPPPIEITDEPKPRKRRRLISPLAVLAGLAITCALVAITALAVRLFLLNESGEFVGAQSRTVEPNSQPDAKKSTGKKSPEKKTETSEPSPKKQKVAPSKPPKKGATKPEEAPAKKQRPSTPNPKPVTAYSVGKPVFAEFFQETELGHVPKGWMGKDGIGVIGTGTQRRLEPAEAIGEYLVKTPRIKFPSEVEVQLVAKSLRIPISQKQELRLYRSGFSGRRYSVKLADRYIDDYVPWTAMMPYRTRLLWQLPNVLSVVVDDQILGQRAILGARPDHFRFLFKNDDALYGILMTDANEKLRDDLPTTLVETFANIAPGHVPPNWFADAPVGVRRQKDHWYLTMDSKGFARAASPSLRFPANFVLNAEIEHGVYSYLTIRLEGMRTSPDLLIGVKSRHNRFNSQATWTVRMTGCDEKTPETTKTILPISLQRKNGVYTLWVDGNPLHARRLPIHQEFQRIVIELASDGQKATRLHSLSLKPIKDPK